MELWAAIDLMGGSVVTLVQGRAAERTVWEESPLRFAERWQDEGADGLHVVDLDAAFGTGSNAEAVLTDHQGSRVPVQVGGGIRTAGGRGWLEDGAARVVVGTMAFRRPGAPRSSSSAYGPERVVVAADYKEVMIVTRGWRESQGIPVVGGGREAQRSRGYEPAHDRRGEGRHGSGPDVATVRRLSTGTKMRDNRLRRDPRHPRPAGAGTGGRARPR